MEDVIFRYKLVCSLIISFALAAMSAYAQNSCGEQLSAASIYKSVPALSNGPYMGTGDSCGVYGTDGLQYQCVEYVRRFYREAKGIDTTTQNWRGDAKAYFSTAQNRGLVSYQNNGQVSPLPDDILVFVGGDYGHVAIITEVTQDKVFFIEQNASNSGVRSLPLTRPMGGYSISTWGSYNVVGWLRVPEPVYTGTVRTNATLNDQPYSGPIDYNIVGPNRVIIGSFVPGETLDAPPGIYNFIYGSGGPPNSLLYSITPQRQQLLNLGQTITYTLNFSAPTAGEWRSLSEGNPGLPGDGVVIEPSGGPLVGRYTFNPPIPLNQFTDQFYWMAFSPNMSFYFQTRVAVTAPYRNPPCTPVVNLFNAGSRAVTMNGVPGRYAGYAGANWITGPVDDANNQIPGCNFTIDDLYFTQIYFLSTTPAQFISPIDAVAFGNRLLHTPPPGFP